jgi:hypothetical protein
MVFAHARPDEWRDGVGINAFFLRAAFPSVDVESEYDWNDRVQATSAPGKFLSPYFPLALPLNYLSLVKPVALSRELGISRTCFSRIALLPSEDRTVDPRTSV